MDTKLFTDLKQSVGICGHFAAEDSLTKWSVCRHIMQWILVCFFSSYIMHMRPTYVPE